LLTGVLLFSCTPLALPGKFKDDRDGKTYKTVKIGKQVWMAENLGYLPSETPWEIRSNTTPYYYLFGSYLDLLDAAMVTDVYNTLGALYNWPAAMTACPGGWHLPSDAEWTELETYLDHNGFKYDGTKEGGDVRSKIAKSLASTNLYLWIRSDKEGSVGNTDYPKYRNKSGFSALPSNADGIGLWWSSTEHDTSQAWYRSLNSDHCYVTRFRANKDNGFSIRCVKD